MVINKKKIGIYKITSPSNKIYIGQSIDIDRRFRYYKKLNCKGQKKLFNSLSKYGTDRHIFDILQLCDVEELNTLERKWQDYYDVIGENGLNLCLTNTDSKRRVFNTESVDVMKKKLSKLLSGENNPFYGKKHSKETCIKMSKSRIGNKNAIGNKRVKGLTSPKSIIILDNDTGIFYSQCELISILGMYRKKLNDYIFNSQKYTIV